MKQHTSKQRDLNKGKGLFENTSITQKDISLFSRQLSTLIGAGIPLLQSFDVIAKGQTKRRFKHLIIHIKQQIETGLTLAEALTQQPLYFNSLYCNLIAAGEKSGTLEPMLNRLATYKEKIESIKKRIKKALSYPIAILIIALLVSAGLLLFVVPQFETLYKSFGAELPTMTRLVITFSTFLKNYWYGVLGLFMGLVLFILHIRKHSSHFAQYYDHFLLKIPVIGSIVKKASIARFARTLSITFSAGLPLLEALQAVAGTTGNILYSKATQKISEAVCTGQPMHIAMKNTLLFPPMVIQMVAIGEESGTLDTMLSKIADFYEEDLDTAVDALSSLLEPILMTVLGILIGGLIIAMYLPIFKLGTAI